MLEDLRDTIFKIIGNQNIEPETDLIRDLSLDSFDIINIVLALEERYKIKIPERDIRKICTVRDIIAYLKNMGVS